MVSKKILRMEPQKALIQKTFEIAIVSDLINIDFQVPTDNLIGQKYLWSLTKATNTQQFMTAAVFNQWQNI